MITLNGIQNSERNNIVVGVVLGKPIIEEAYALFDSIKDQVRQIFLIDNTPEQDISK